MKIKYMIRILVPKKIRHWIITIWHKFKYRLIIGKNNYISDCKFENNCAVDDNCKITSSVIGKYSYITDGANISNAKIGRYCSIGPNLRIGMASHPLKKFVSTSPLFYLKQTNLKTSFTNKNKFISHKFVDKSKLYFVEIGNDVWIGSNVTILDGVKVGNGSVIGANSLVTKNVAPYSVVVGNPVKIIKFRFTKSQIKMLQSLKWWNKTEKWILSNSNNFDNIKKICKKKLKK